MRYAPLEKIFLLVFIGFVIAIFFSMSFVTYNRNFAKNPQQEEFILIFPDGEVVDTRYICNEVTP